MTLVAVESRMDIPYYCLEDLLFDSTERWGTRRTRVRHYGRVRCGFDPGWGL